MQFFALFIFMRGFLAGNNPAECATKNSIVLTSAGFQLNDVIKARRTHQSIGVRTYCARAGSVGSISINLTTSPWVPRLVTDANNSAQFYPPDNIIREVVKLNTDNFVKYDKNFDLAELNEILRSRGLLIKYQQTQKLELGHPLAKLIDPITYHEKTQYVTSPQPTRLSFHEMFPGPNDRYGFTLYGNGSTKRHLNDEIFYSSDYASEAYFNDGSTADNLAQATKYIVKWASNSPQLTPSMREHYVSIAHAFDHEKVELAFIANNFGNRIINFERLPCVGINRLASSEKILNCLSHPSISLGYEELLHAFECAASSGSFL